VTDQGPDEPARIDTGRTLVVDDGVPQHLRTAAAWSWRLLLVAALLAVGGLVFWVLRALAIPLFVAVLAATQMLPAARWLTARGLPRWLAVIAVMLALLAGIAFLTIVIVGSLVSQLDHIGHLVSKAADEVTDWLQHHEGPLRLTGSEVVNLGHQAARALASAAGALFGGVLGGASLFTQLVSGTTLAFASLIYLLSDGEHVGAWLIAQAAPERRPAVQRMAVRGWTTLGAYVRGLTIVAAVDAVLIGADPIVYRKQVNLHPIATLAAVTVGGVLAGVIGALIAVPVVALGWAVTSEYRRIAGLPGGSPAGAHVTRSG
jgi:predicted PurR-regulated permease PerM